MDATDRNDERVDERVDVARPADMDNIDDVRQLLAQTASNAQSVEQHNERLGRWLEALRDVADQRRHELDAAVAKVARVEALHTRGRIWVPVYAGETQVDDHEVDGCTECEQQWPCSTVTALAEPADTTTGNDEVGG